MELLRKPDWPKRLHVFLLDESLFAPRSFAYGEMDCCLWVADAVRAMTGTDLAAPFRGQYRSRKQALALAKTYTGRERASLRAFIETALGGLPTVPVSCAQRGDILLVKRSRDVSLGILALNGKVILAAAAEGFLRLPLALALRAWRV